MEIPPTGFAELVLPTPSSNHVAALPHTPATPAYSVRVLHRDHLEDWQWHPHIMERIIRFCSAYEGQGDPEALVRNIQQSFVMDDPGLMVIAFFKDGHLIGHILCDRAVLYFKPIVAVHQYMLDRSIPDQIRNDAVQLIRDWAKDTGPEEKREPAQFIQWLVRDKKLARMYQRFFNAKPQFLLMRMSVEEG